MKLTITLLLGGLFCCGAAFSADTMTLAKLYDGELKMVESQIVPLVDAMPVDKFNFVPAGGGFTGVRTFAQQAKHVAVVMYNMAASAKQEKPPVELGAGESGPDSIVSKQEIVQLLKDAFAYAHAVIATLNEKNYLDLVKNPFGPDVARGSIASAPVWHGFDHYGQMVVYLRMNGIVPPASR